MLSSKISIIIPVIRPESAKRCIQSIIEKSGLKPDQYEIIAEIDKDRIGCPLMVRNLVAKTKHDLVCFVGDDTELEPDCLKIALEVMNRFPEGWGLVGLNDGTGRNLPTHWLAHKHLLKYLGGEFFHTGYSHCFCDSELRDRAMEIDRFVMAMQAKVKHHHPLLDGKPIEDPDLKRVYSPKLLELDKNLYYLRRMKRAGFKLAIALPLMSGKVHVQFMMSFLAMEKPNYTLLTPVFPTGEFAESISATRNNLVTQALNEGCTHLIMMDTDQIYPADTVTKLLSHDKPVVGTPVHRRYPPFDPILYRGTIGKYTHVPDAKCYSGELVEVDATGCGCILYSMRCFLDIQPPWFNFTNVPETGRTVGEDIHFCHKLKQAGYEIFVDTSIEIGHMTTYEVTKETYMLFKKFNNFAYREAA